LTITAEMGCPDRRRQIHRLGGDYLLNMARLVALAINRDFTTALTFLAITRANVRPLVESGESARQYRGVADLPPDEVRAPVTIYVIARDLGLPYETVRRHVAKLKAAGLCVSAEGGGVIIPSRALDDPATLEYVTQCWRTTVAFVEESASFGIVAPGDHPPTGPEFARHVVRLATDYFLDGMRIMADTMDLDVLSVLVLRAVAVGNVARLAHDPRLGRVHGGLADIPPDDQRVPVSAYAVSKFLLLPYETTRRTLVRLIELGLVERRESGGLVAPAAVVARPDVVAGTVKLAALTETFLKRLAEVGVVPGAELPALAGAPPTPTARDLAAARR
jgi:DNA-binding transcriptional ArsR family regulator